MSMVKAMARKTVLEGPTSMQQAAYNCSIIQCSGSFATSSKNGKVIKVWDMTVLDNKTATVATAEKEDNSSVTNIMMKNNVAKVCLVQELQHDAVIEVIKATEDGQTIIAGDVMGDICLWRKSSSNKSLLSGFKGTNKSSSWSLIHKFTWRDDIDNKRGSSTSSIHPPNVIFQHSITSLCFLLDDGSKFVSGTKEGLVQIWNGNDNKLPPQTIRVAEVPLSSIQKLPSNGDDKLEGLSVCCADGSIVALKLVMEEGNVVELDAFPVDCSKRVGGGSESSVISSINSIALPCKDKMGPANSTVMLIAGDDKGNIHLTDSPLD
jgi:WD40 repeat protein